MSSLILFFACQEVNAQTFYPPNQNTVAWDAVTDMNVDGAPVPIPAGDTIKYNVYTVPVDEPKENAQLEMTVTETQATITRTTEGRVFVGVETVRIPEGETFQVLSDRIAWSDDPNDCQNGETFGLSYYYLPYASGGIRHGG